jgi:hypothetical protein
VMWFSAPQKFVNLHHSCRVLSWKGILEYFSVSNKKFFLEENEFPSTFLMDCNGVFSHSSISSDIFFASLEWPSLSLFIFSHNIDKMIHLTFDFIILFSLQIFGSIFHKVQYLINDLNTLISAKNTKYLSPPTRGSFSWAIFPLWPKQNLISSRRLSITVFLASPHRDGLKVLLKLTFARMKLSSRKMVDSSWSGICFGQRKTPKSGTRFIVNCWSPWIHTLLTCKPIKDALLISKL